MAIIKAVSSRNSIAKVIDYVSKEEKTDQQLMSGINCSPETAKDEMQLTKDVWDKNEGRSYKHFVQSFAPEEKITPEQAHEIACKLAAQVPAWKGHEVLIATHKDREHIHTHFVVNSVNFENGYKLNWSKHDLVIMKERSNELCKEHNLHVPEKGKTFAGEDREETTAYEKDTYQLLKKAERGEVKSYVQDIAMAVMDCREKAISKDDFIKQMNNRGYGVEWTDNRKHITFTDLERQQQGEAKCKVRNNKLEQHYNIDFSKGALENGFEVNARKQESTRESAGTGAAEAKNAFTGQGSEDTRTFLEHINSKVGNAEAGRKEREAEQRRLSAERERRIKAENQRSRERGYSR